MLNLFLQQMEEDSSNLLVNSSIQGESTLVSGLRTPVYESDLISGTRAETEASIRSSLVPNDDSNTCHTSTDIWSECMHHPNSAPHSEEFEESCSDQMSVENHTSEVSTSYDHGPVRLPSHEHLNVSDAAEEEEEEEEEDEEDEEEVEEQIAEKGRKEKRRKKKKRKPSLRDRASATGEQFP